MPDIFISYSQKDKGFVSKLASSLESRGYDVWWDHELIAGQDWSNAIHDKLAQAQCVITVWSVSSVNRPWVRAESTEAMQREVLVPIRIDEVRIPMPFNILQTEDLTVWNEQAFQRLLNGIKLINKKRCYATDIEKSDSKKGLITGVLLILVIGFLLGKSLQNKRSNNSHLDLRSVEVPKDYYIKTRKYIDNHDGTITDNATGLMWKKCSEGVDGNKCLKGDIQTYSWSDAIRKFEGVSFAGYKDWRLPSINELASLIHCSDGVNIQSRQCNGKHPKDMVTIDQGMFPSHALDPRFHYFSFWSSSPEAQKANSAWVVDFKDGAVHTAAHTDSFFVRLVRTHKRMNK